MAVTWGSILVGQKLETKFLSSKQITIYLMEGIKLFIRVGLYDYKRSGLHWNELLVMAIII